MPGVAAEMFWPRWAWWFSCGVMVVFAVFFASACVDAVVRAAPWGTRWTVVVGAVAIAFGTVAAEVFVLVLYRPLHRPDSSVVRPGPVVLPGSRRAVGSALASALVLFLLSCVVAWAASGGWRVFWVVVALLLVPVVVDHLFSVPHARRLVLTPQSVRAVSFRLDAEVAWDDIESIEWKQAMNGLMVARIMVKPGASSFIVHWKHPFLRRRNAIDVELLVLDLDPLLVMMALTLFECVPESRAELATGRIPERFFDIDHAVATVPLVLGTRWLRTFRPRRRKVR